MCHEGGVAEEGAGWFGDVEEWVGGVEDLGEGGEEFGAIEPVFAEVVELLGGGGEVVWGSGALDGDGSSMGVARSSLPVGSMSPEKKRDCRSAAWSTVARANPDGGGRDLAFFAFSERWPRSR